MAHMQSYIDRFRYKASKARQAQSRIKALERMEKVLPAQFDNPFSFEFRQPDALPNPIIMMDQVSAGYGDNLILEENSPQPCAWQSYWFARTKWCR